MTITTVKTNKVRNILIICAVALLVGGLSLFGYQQYRKKNGVYVETLRQGDGWGYRIYVKGQLVVDQYVMPAVSGSKPFPCEKSARKTAEVVVQRVGKGGSPTVSLEEVTQIVAENCN